MPLHIPEPCHEDWGKMNPTDRGRHCHACHKDVHDFTVMADVDILRAVGDKSKQVCGRISNVQLQRINSSGRNMLLRPAAMLAIIGSAGMSFLTGSAMAQDGVAVQLTNHIATDSIQVNGTVSGSDSNQVLAGIKVMVKINGDERYVAYTDGNGRFALNIKKDEQATLGLLVVSDTGNYEDGDIDSLPWNDQHIDVRLEAKPEVAFTWSDISTGIMAIDPIVGYSSPMLGYCISVPDTYLVTVTETMGLVSMPVTDDSVAQKYPIQTSAKADSAAKETTLNNTSKTSTPKQPEKAPVDVDNSMLLPNEIKPRIGRKDSNSK